MLFEITNEGRGPRPVLSTSGRRVTIMPGDKKNVDLTPETAASMYRMQTKPAKNPVSLIVRPLDDEGREALNAPAPVKDKLPPPRPIVIGGLERPTEVTEAPAEVSPYVGDANSAKTELLTRADTLSRDELRAEAALVLGKDAPAKLNKMTKEDIKRLLAS